MSETKKGWVQTVLFAAAVAALFLVKYQGIPIGAWAAGLALVVLYHPMTAEVFVVGLWLTLTGAVTYAATSRLTNRRAGLLLTVALVAILAFNHVRMSSKLGNLRERFLGAAGQSAEWVNHGMVGEEQYTALDYGGALDEIVAERNTVLADNGYVILGKWEVSDSGAQFSGFYIWVGPLARLGR